MNEPYEGLAAMANYVHFQCQDIIAIGCNSKLIFVMFHRTFPRTFLRLGRVLSLGRWTSLVGFATRVCSSELHVSRFDDVWWCDRCDLRQGIGKWRVLCRVTAALALAGWIWIVDQWQKPCFNRSIGRKKEKRSNTVKSRNDCHILRGTRITKVARKLSKTVIDFFIRGVSWGLPDGRNALSCTFQTWSQRRCSFCRNTRVRWRLLCLPSALFALSALSWRSFLEAMHWVRAGHNKSAKIDFRDLYGSLQTFIFINSMFHGRGRQIMATPSAEYFARKSLR